MRPTQRAYGKSRQRAFAIALAVLLIFAVTFVAADRGSRRTSLPLNTLPSMSPPAPTAAVGLGISPPNLDSSPPQADSDAGQGVACPVRCVVRWPVADPSAVWQHGTVAYAIVDATTWSVPGHAGVTASVVQSGDDTLTLYGIFGVQPAHEALVASLGTVLDRIGDVRLIAAQKLPLDVAALYAVGIHVEKVAPSCAGSLTSFSLVGTINDITASGTSTRFPLGDRQYDGGGTVQTAAYLYCRFAALGFRVRYDDLVDNRGRQQLNVVAEPPGWPLGPETTLVTAHYDSRSPGGQSAPGADDNASGVAAMIDLANRVAREGFARPVGFVAFAAEEPGLLGSTAFASRLKQTGGRMRASINLDAIGIHNEGRYYINGDAASRGLYLSLVRASTDDQTLLWMSDRNFLSDDESFRRYGYIAVMITTHPFGTEPLHHTERDQIGKLDLGQIAAITDLVWRYMSQQIMP